MAVDSRPGTEPTASEDERPADHAPLPALELTDLLNDLETLAPLLIRQVWQSRTTSIPRERGEHVLDAYLLAVGMQQIVEDHLHGSAFRSQRASRGPRAVASRIRKGAASATDSMRPLYQRDVVASQASLQRLSSMLARAVAGEGELDAEAWQLARGIVGTTPRLPEPLRRTLLRLPDCYRSFDQQPDDCRRLVEAFAAQWPDRNRRLLVVGVRTSGSYQAPLTAAYLEKAGFTKVDWMTFRPGQTWAAAERESVEAVVRDSGLALLVDDPPVTGGKLAASADRLHELGIPVDSVVMLLALLGDEASLPKRLKSRQVVVLPWQRWAIVDRLTEPALREEVTRALAGGDVVEASGGRVRVSAIEDIEDLPLEPIADVKARPLVRSHLRTARRVRFRDDTGRAGSIDVYIKGVGLGYFGRHSVAVSRSLGNLTPSVYGSVNGLVFRAFQAESSRLESPARDDAVAIAGYAAGRARALPASEDKSLRMAGRHPAWEQASGWLASGLGPLQPLMRPFLNSYTQRVLRSPRPSVVDGSMALSNWFRGDAGALLKVDYDDRAFSVWNSYCYDPAFDVAIAAADWEFRSDGAEQTRPADLLRAEYEAASGDAIGDVRWFLYRMIHLRSGEGHLERLVRDGPTHLQASAGRPAETGTVDEVGFEAALTQGIDRYERAISRVHNFFVAGLFLGDVALPRGPLVEVNVEKCLESDWLSAGSLTSQGATVLRSLLVHGHRPVLRTARSVSELRHRFAAYRADGGSGSDGEITPATGEVAARVDSEADVARLLGHRPGSCPECRAPRLTREQRVLLNLLDARGASGMRLANLLGRVLVAG